MLLLPVAPSTDSHGESILDFHTHHEGLAWEKIIDHQRLTNPLEHASVELLRWDDNLTIKVPLEHDDSKSTQTGIACNTSPLARGMNHPRPL